MFNCDLRCPFCYTIVEHEERVFCYVCQIEWKDNRMIEARAQVPPRLYMVPTYRKRYNHTNVLNAVQAADKKAYLYFAQRLRPCPDDYSQDVDIRMFVPRARGQSSPWDSGSFSALDDEDRIMTWHRNCAK